MQCLRLLVGRLCARFVRSRRAPRESLPASSRGRAPLPTAAFVLCFDSAGPAGALAGRRTPSRVGLDAAFPQAQGRPALLPFRGEARRRRDRVAARSVAPRPLRKRRRRALWHL
ncbi:hypothetical protein M885DRAFT_134441 [Pelagophyceae sp. CCMP2097]|nr:hypothetical protein M885DRAFT_134441 [Pelagophyceae sp. CCMP2097]